MRPEFPYLAAGAVAIGGAAMREKAWPKEAPRAIVGTVALVLLASASSDTPLAPLVHAFGLLVLLIAVMTAVRINMKGK